MSFVDPVDNDALVANDGTYEDDPLGQLPEFTRSLLKVNVQVSVTIAECPRPVSQILDIGPGSIMQFDKHFEEPLILEANGERLAHGIAVRAGEFFGFQVTEMLMPPERFWTVQPPEKTTGQTGG
jgi:flagellar motor switch protein FliN/FliY